MTAPFAPPQSSLDKLYAAIARLAARHDFTRIADAAALEAALPVDGGLAVLLLTEDPQRSPESLDVAVVLPEALKTLGLPVRGLVADAEASPALARLYGVSRYPTVVVLRDGAYLGAFGGILDWAPFVTELHRLVTAAPTRPPISIASQTARSCA